MLVDELEEILHLQAQLRLLVAVAAAVMTHLPMVEMVVLAAVLHIKIQVLLHQEQEHQDKVMLEVMLLQLIKVVQVVAVVKLQQD